MSDQTTSPDQAETIPDYVYRLGLTLRVSRLHHGNVVTDAEGWEHRAYRVTLVRPDGRTLSTHYRMGTGNGTTRPTAPEVLNSLRMDASSVTDYAGAFLTWARDYGFQVDAHDWDGANGTDTPRARRIWDACQRIAARLDVFLDPAELDQLRECEAY